MRTTICTLVVPLMLVVAKADFVINVPMGQTIPDGDASGMVSSITVSDHLAPIGTLLITLNISGGCNGDLYAYITHGSAFAVLLNRVGRTDSNDSGYNDPGLNVTFSDSAANDDIHKYRETLLVNLDQPPGVALQQSWQPDGRNVNPYAVTDNDLRAALLSSFSGADPIGQWTLFVADLNGGQVATLESWKLESVVPVPESSTFISGLIMVTVFTFQLRRKQK